MYEFMIHLGQPRGTLEISDSLILMDTVSELCIFDWRKFRVPIQNSGWLFSFIPFMSSHTWARHNNVQAR